MSQKLLLKKSSVAGKVPSSADLSYGEVALNYADGKLYFKDSTNAIKSFAAQLGINDLVDVDTLSNAPTVGQVLKWNGTNWVPGDDATVGGTGTDADTLDGFDSSYFLNYNNLSNRPTLFSGSYNDLTDTPTLFSGSYNDLTDTPTLFSGAYSDLTGTPTLFSGSYNDLTDTPTVINTAVQWTVNHTLQDGTRYLSGDVVYDNGNLFVANYDNESLPTSNAEYWTNLGPGNRLNIDGRDIPNIDYTQLINKPSLFSGSYNDLTDKPSVPTLTSQLTNNSGFTTETYVNTAVANLVDSSPSTLNTLNELAAALGNDPNFATTIASQIGQKANTASLSTVATTGSYTDLLNKPSLFSGSYVDLTNKPSLFSGSYTDLTNKPTIPTVPTNVSAFTNDANYATQTFVTSGLSSKQNTLVSGTSIKTINGVSVLGSGDIVITSGSSFSGSYTDLTNKPTLSTVATTGSYNDLLNKPSLFSGAYASLTGKPTLSTVSATGSYNDLLNKPTLFSGSYTDLTNKPSLFSGSYNDLTSKPTLFSGSYTDLTNKPTLFSGSYTDLTSKPTLFSGSYTDLTNKPTLFSGSYTDLTNKPTLFSGSYTDLTSKPTFKTIGGQSIIGSGDIAITGGGGSSAQEYSVDNLSTTPTTIDSIPLADLTSARYNMVMVNDLGDYETTEFVVIHNGSLIDYQQYNQFALNDSTGSITAEIDGSNAVIKFVGNSTTNIKFTRTTISKVLGPGLRLPTDLETESFGVIDLRTDNYPEKDLN